MKVLKIFHLSICRIANNLDELKSTILCNNHKIDLCGFSETFLTHLVDDRCLEVGGGLYVAWKRIRLCVREMEHFRKCKC